MKTPKKSPLWLIRRHQRADAEYYRCIRLTDDLERQGSRQEAASALYRATRSMLFAHIGTGAPE